MQRSRQIQTQTKNRGSVMILVLVCMFMISLIGVMVLSATMMNYRMKLTQSQAAENFYDAESVMEEVTVQLRQTVMNAYRESYKKLLLNYLDETVVADRQAYFILDIVSQLELYPEAKAELGTDIYIAQNGGDLAEVLGIINAKLGVQGKVSVAGSDSVLISVRKQQMRIRELKLEFTDADGYQTDIKTDLLITLAMPDDSFAADGPQINRDMDNYVIVSDADIISNSSGTEGAGGTVAYVDGSVYAGNDIKVNAGLQLTGSRVVVGENLKLPFGSRFEVQTGMAEHDGIWVRNIILSGGTLDLSGDCYVVDDTSFEERFSSMTIKNGGYYGYSYSEAAEGDPYLSSAILLNKPDITLDLSAADMLWLAGSAYIREKNLFDDIADSEPAVEGVLEGESIAYKNLQAAYLIPGCCLVGVGHNPLMMSQTFSRSKGETLTKAYMISEAGKVTQTEMAVVSDMKINGVAYGTGDVVPAGILLPIGTVLPAGTVLPCDVSTPIAEMVLNKGADGSDFVEDGYYIDLPVSRTEVGIDLSKYADAIRPVTVRYSNTKQMVYFYLRFLNPQKAAEYLREFVNTTGGSRLLKQLETLGMANVSLPAPQHIVTVGNLTEYSYDYINAQADYGIVPSVSADNLLWRESLLTSNYNALLSKLMPGGRLDSSAVPVASSAVSAFDYLINPIRLAEEQAEDRDDADNRKLVAELCTDAAGNTIQFCVAAGRGISTTAVSTMLGSPLTNAVIISDGEVVIDSAFSGIIIAKGNVSLNVSGMGEQVTQGATGLANLIGHEVIGPYFNAYQPTKKEDKKEENRLQMTELIQLDFEGWVKN